MSGHHKNRGFHQTSKRWDGALKAQQQASRSKQRDHSADARSEDMSESREQSSSASGTQSKQNKRM
jgi:hypothetical protein